MTTARLLLAAILLAVWLPAHAGDRAVCDVSVKLAYDAYLAVTPDAKYPDANALRYAVDYLGDMQPFQYDREAAELFAEYIAMRMSATPFREPPPGVVYELARHLLVTYCLPLK